MLKRTLDAYPLEALAAALLGNGPERYVSAYVRGYGEVRFPIQNMRKLSDCGTEAHSFADDEKPVAKRGGRIRSVSYVWSEKDGCYISPEWVFL